MLEILAITGPIYLVIAAGYLCTRQGLFSKADLRIFGQFVIQLALPALLFNALSQRRFGDILNATYMAAYALGSLGMVLLGWWGKRRLAGLTRTESAMATMGMACPNSGYVGYPILQMTLPAVAGVALALNMLVENLLILPLLLALAERGDAPDTSGSGGAILQQSLQRLLANPMVRGLLLGLTVSALDLTLPAPLTRAVTLFAQASSALSLFVIGGALYGLSMDGMVGRVGTIMAGKLLVHPLLVGGALWGLQALGAEPLSPELRQALILTGAMPIMGIYPILAQRYGHEGFSAAALLGTTVGSFLTLNLLLWWLK